MHQKMARRSMGITLKIPETRSFSNFSTPVTPQSMCGKLEFTTSPVPKISPSPVTPNSLGLVKFPDTPCISPKSPKQYIDVHDYDCIIDEHLYLGNEESSINKKMLQKHNIKKVLNVSHDCETPNELYEELNIEHKHIKIRDHSDAPIQLYLDDMMTFIHTSISNKEPILVHCKKGWSRSATVVIAYIIMFGRPLHMETNASYNDALKFVGSKRREIQPNLGFCMLLNDLSIARGFRDSFFDE